MPIPLIEAKQQLRSRLRSALHALDADFVAAASASMVAHLTGPGGLPPSARTVALFGGIAGEPDLLSLIPWLVERGRRAVFFGFADGQLVPRLVSHQSQLERGIFGVWVPHATCQVISPQELDVILTPGLGFDRRGHRLGRGRGHFDRLFASRDVLARRIGVCFECQILDEVPVEAHDARMDALVTEAAAITIDALPG